MNTPEIIYPTFAHLMDTEQVWSDPSVTFADICRRLDVSPRRFNRFLYEELGFRGEEILSVYRQSADKKA